MAVGWACMARGHVWQGACAWQGGMYGRGACVAGCVCDGVWQGGMHGREEGACVAGKMAIAAGGTHPTGMHSCIP